LISIRIVMVFGCWVKMDNPFDLFWHCCNVGGLFDFWAYWLDYTYFIPLSLQHAQRFNKYPAGYLRRLLHITITITSSQSLPFHICLLLFFFRIPRVSEYPYRPQASAAAAICLKQYHIPLNQFLSFVSLYIRRGNGV
jgi:hypothetical protein